MVKIQQRGMTRTIPGSEGMPPVELDEQYTEIFFEIDTVFPEGEDSVVATREGITCIHGDEGLHCNVVKETAEYIDKVLESIDVEELEPRWEIGDFMFESGSVRGNTAPGGHVQSWWFPETANESCLVINDSLQCGSMRHVDEWLRTIEQGFMP